MKTHELTPPFDSIVYVAAPILLLIAYLLFLRFNGWRARTKAAPVEMPADRPDPDVRIRVQWSIAHRIYHFRLEKWYYRHEHPVLLQTTPETCFGAWKILAEGNANDARVWADRYGIEVPTYGL